MEHTRILVTGAAGFIGSRVFQELSSRGYEVTGIDNINDYYDVRMKYGRLSESGVGMDAESYGKEVLSTIFPAARFIRMSIDDRAAMERLFETGRFDMVINLAAQAGVRYSITNPYAYLQSNLTGFLNILECCRNFAVKHLVYASSSSVYGLNESVPYNEKDQVDRPVSLYAATKKSNELMAHAYSKLYGIPVTGLRFFTVYGPWGRPDMSPMLFADAICHDRQIKIFNNGDMIRDFTYIDDIVEGTVMAMEHIPDANDDGVRYRIYNIGCSHPVRLMDFIGELETALGKKARKIFLPMQPGDVYRTFADTSRLETEIGYRPHVTLHEGISRFIGWYRSDLNPLSI
ncbi:MAG: NAD-dependent epimerase/dehydratase family protein [Bacteroidales bacterium]|nr:NAD-dependent epimerase/dehydratase family protein [Bacteroidales bacterium]MDE7126678.1 NAD-dependent epimerase/dehydratase family protein [Bacteroidales bacterium]